MSLATQFTEDIFATEDSVCQRTSCQAPIPRGQPRHYVRSIDDTRRGKYYCGRCFERVQNSFSTVNVSPLPDAQSIRQSISAAQSRATVNPPPVRAMGSSSMPPPPLPRRPSSSHRPSAFQPPYPGSAPSVSMGRPDVRVPSAWNNPQGPPPLLASSSLPPRSIGYGPQHAYYDAHHRHWANCSRVPPAETYSLQVSAMYECGGIKKGLRGNPIGSISEGLKGVDALSTAPELVAIALDAVTPRILAHQPPFLWRVNEFTVRDAKWVDLSKQSITAPYFYEDCLQPSNRKNAKGSLVFKKDKHFSLFVVVPANQWKEFEDSQLEATAPMPEGLAIRQRQRLRIQSTLASSSESTRSTFTTSSAPIISSDPEPQDPSRSSNTHRHHFDMDPSTTSSGPPAITEPASTLPHSISQARTSESSSLSVASNFNYVGASHMTKRHHRHPSDASSMSEGMPHSPPPKKHAVDPFISIDRNELKEALVSGGSADFNLNDVLTQKVEQVDFFPIPTRPLNTLRGRPCFRITEDDKSGLGAAVVEVFSSSLRMNMATKEILGVGGFKTTQLAQLTIYPLREAGIGARAKHDIVVKRPYVRQNGEAPKAPFLRPTFKDESMILYREANVFYWAKALLKHTYDYVDSCIHTASNPPPFKIPRLSFVDAGILLAYSERTSGTTLTKGRTASAMYLAEELIPLSAGETFVKYIHNGDAKPRVFRDAAVDEIAEFLAFTQHVQYITSEKLTYISDYQGHGLLLTDPQILTHADLGKNLFGEGNVEFGVSLFERQHTCNKYCKWPGFGLHEFVLHTSH